MSTVAYYTQMRICRVPISYEVILSRIFHQPDNRTQHDTSMSLHPMVFRCQSSQMLNLSSESEACNYVQSACNFIGWSYQDLFVLQWCSLLFCAERIGWLALSISIVLDFEYTPCVQFQEHLLVLMEFP